MAASAKIFSPSWKTVVSKSEPAADDFYISDSDESRPSTKSRRLEHDEDHECSNKSRKFDKADAVVAKRRKTGENINYRDKLNKLLKAATEDVDNEQQDEHRQTKRIKI